MEIKNGCSNLRNHFRSDGDVIIAGLMIGACQYEMPGNVQPTVFPRPQESRTWVVNEAVHLYFVPTMCTSISSKWRPALSIS